MNPVAHFIADLVYSLLRVTPERLRTRIEWREALYVKNKLRGWTRRMAHHKRHLTLLRARLAVLEGRVM